MFQFPGLPPPSLCVQLGVAGYDSCWVRPFGDPRVTGHVRLTVAYRSLSRPSSASCAKASTVCPYHLPFDGSVHTYTQGRQRPCAIRCDLLEKENIVFKSRYAALKVRRGRPPGTGHCAHRVRGDGTQRALAGTAPFNKVKVVSLERLFSLERR